MGCIYGAGLAVQSIAEQRPPAIPFLFVDCVHDQDKRKPSSTRSPKPAISSWTLEGKSRVFALWSLFQVLRIVHFATGTVKV